MAFEGEDAKRWEMTSAPQLSPGADYFTRSAVGPFLDTGLEVSFGQKGHIYISVETIKEMAIVAGVLEDRNAEQTAVYEREIYNTGYAAGLLERDDLDAQLSAILDRVRDLSPAAGGDDLPDDLDDTPDEGAGGEAPGASEDAGVVVHDAAPVGGGSRRATRPANRRARSNDVPGVGDVNPRFQI